MTIASERAHAFVTVVATSNCEREKCKCKNCHHNNGLVDFCILNKHLPQRRYFNKLRRMRVCACVCECVRTHGPVCRPIFDLGCRENDTQNWRPNKTTYLILSKLSILPHSPLHAMAQMRYTLFYVFLHFVRT